MHSIDRNWLVVLGIYLSAHALTLVDAVDYCWLVDQGIRNAFVPLALVVIYLVLRLVLARCLLVLLKELPDGDLRFVNLCHGIVDCHFGVHAISAVEVDHLPLLWILLDLVVDNVCISRSQWLVLILFHVDGFLLLCAHDLDAAILGLNFLELLMHLPDLLLPTSIFIHEYFALLVLNMFCDD